RLSYVSQANGSQDLGDAVAKVERDLGDDARRLYYLSIPPAAAPVVLEELRWQGLAERASIVLEKPFGVDLATARALNAALHETFDEEHIYRIDHFLGKEAALNILAFRFAN